VAGLVGNKGQCKEITPGEREARKKCRVISHPVIPPVSGSGSAPASMYSCLLSQYHNILLSGPQLSRGINYKDINL